MNISVRPHIRRLAPSENRPEIDQNTVALSSVVDLKDRDRPQFLGLGTSAGHVNLDPKIRSTSFDCVTKRPILPTMILRCITCNDHPAAPSYQLIQPKILKMSAVRQIQVRSMIMCRSEQFGQEQADTGTRNAPPPKHVQPEDLETTSPDAN